MAIRIDEYGHIIRDNTSTSVNTTNSAQNSSAEQSNAPNDAASVNRYMREAQAITSSNTSNTQILETSTPWYGNDGVFWTITMILSLAVALVMSMKVAPLIFEASESSSDFLESIINFLLRNAPYAIFIGTFVGSIWYNSAGTKKSENYHAAYEYILSPLCAAAGAVGTGLLIFLLAVSVYIIAIIVVIYLIIMVIVVLFSGG